MEGDRVRLNVAGPTDSGGFLFFFHEQEMAHRVDRRMVVVWIFWFFFGCLFFSKCQPEVSLFWMRLTKPGDRISPNSWCFVVFLGA